MQGATRFRPHSLKVFVPLTKGFHTRQQRGRRAVIAITYETADLGHYPHGLIANDLAGRFGGFSNDFSGDLLPGERLRHLSPVVGPTGGAYPEGRDSPRPLSAPLLCVESLQRSGARQADLQGVDQTYELTVRVLVR